MDHPGPNMAMLDFRFSPWFPPFSSRPEEFSPALSASDGTLRSSEVETSEVGRRPWGNGNNQKNQRLFPRVSEGRPWNVAMESSTDGANDGQQSTCWTNGGKENAVTIPNQWLLVDKHCFMIEVTIPILWLGYSIHQLVYDNQQLIVMFLSTLHKLTIKRWYTPFSVRHHQKPSDTHINQLENSSHNWTQETKTAATNNNLNLTCWHFQVGEWLATPAFYLFFMILGKWPISSTSTSSHDYPTCLSWIPSRLRHAAVFRFCLHQFLHISRETSKFSCHFFTVSCPNEPTPTTAGPTDPSQFPRRASSPPKGFRFSSALLYAFKASAYFWACDHCDRHLHPLQAASISLLPTPKKKKISFLPRSFQQIYIYICK